MITDYNDFVATGFQLVALSLSLSLSLSNESCMHAAWNIMHNIICKCMIYQVSKNTHTHFGIVLPFFFGFLFGKFFM